MPATDRNQKAVLWPITGYDAASEPTFGSPRQIMVRWVDSDTMLQGAKTENVRQIAMVVVGEDVEIGSLMWKGALADFTNDGGNKIGMVAFFKKTPDLKGRTFRRKADLHAYKGTVPS